MPLLFSFILWGRHTLPPTGGMTSTSTGTFGPISSVLQGMPPSLLPLLTYFPTSSHQRRLAYSRRACSSFYHPKSTYLASKNLKVERNIKEKEKMHTFPPLFQGPARAGISGHFHTLPRMCLHLKSHPCKVLYLVLLKIMA